MPIKPENKHLYPSNWKEIRADILKRAGNKCEFCGLENHSIVDRKGKPVKIVLTIAHLDNDPTHNSPENLRALCQKCHLTYDAKMHAEHAAETRRKQKNYNEQLSLFEL